MRSRNDPFPLNRLGDGQSHPLIVLLIYTMIRYVKRVAKPPFHCYLTAIQTMFKLVRADLFPHFVLRVKQRISFCEDTLFVSVIIRMSLFSCHMLVLWRIANSF